MLYFCGRRKIMKVNQKSGIYKIEGEFSQNGILAPENSFSGFVELEKDFYTYKDVRIGEVNIVFFKGIQVDGYDEDKKSRLVLGGIQETKDFLNLYFRKLVNSEEATPIAYGVESENKNIEGTYEGEWAPVDNFMSSEYAKITEFRELSDAEVFALKVKEFLKKGYEETKKLPPQMKVVAMQEEQSNDFIKAKARKTTPSQPGDK